MTANGNLAPDASSTTVASLLRAMPRDPGAFDAQLHGLLDRDGVSAVERLLTEVGYHGVSGVVDRRIASDRALPDSIRDQSSRRLAVEELWQAHLMRELERAAHVLAEAGVQACALKGPALGARLYAPQATRHCMDIDLLVSPDDFPRATQALARAGYGPEHGHSVEYLRKYSHHLGFTRAAGPPLELHFRAYAGFGVHVGAEALLARARPFALPDGSSVFVPAVEDEFMYLAIHAAGHSFVRLVWLYDLKLLAESSPMDWDVVARRARAAGVMHAVAFAARLANDWLGAGWVLPQPFASHGGRAALATRLLPEASRMQRRSARENMEGLLFTSLLCDRPVSTAWMLQHHVGRACRRRLKQWAPGYLPDSWSA